MEKCSIDQGTENESASPILKTNDDTPSSLNDTNNNGTDAAILTHPLLDMPKAEPIDSNTCTDLFDKLTEHLKQVKNTFDKGCDLIKQGKNTDNSDLSNDTQELQDQVNFQHSTIEMKNLFFLGQKPKTSFLIVLLPI